MCGAENGKKSMQETILTSVPPHTWKCEHDKEEKSLPPF